MSPDECRRHGWPRLVAQLSLGEGSSRWFPRRLPTLRAAGLPPPRGLGGPAAARRACAARSPGPQGRRCPGRSSPPPRPLGCSPAVRVMSPASRRGEELAGHPSSGAAGPHLGRAGGLRLQRAPRRRRPSGANRSARRLRQNRRPPRRRLGSRAGLEARVPTSGVDGARAARREGRAGRGLPGLPGRGRARGGLALGGGAAAWGRDGGGASPSSTVARATSPLSALVEARRRREKSAGRPYLFSRELAAAAAAACPCE